VADKLAAILRSDSAIGSKALFLDGYSKPADAVQATLRSALEANRPGLIVTTSHGRTGPLEKPDETRANLGLLVDSDAQVLDPSALLGAWQPDGAVWYAHACCSAGASGDSLFADLFDADSALAKLLKGLAALGSCVSPLPRALLGAKKPLRAFIGHVEPTFDWTLRNPNNGQHVTKALTTALYNGLFTWDRVPNPVGWALNKNNVRLSALASAQQDALVLYNEGQEVRGTLLYCGLAFSDVRSMVLLGDPTVGLPPLPAA